MKILTIIPTSIDISIIEVATHTIQKGGVVVFPSDSCYGLAVDPKNEKALARLYAIKGRPREKAVSCIFRNIEEIQKWSKLSLRQLDILKKNLPGPFTFLVKPNNNYPLGNNLVGVRIPNFHITKTLSEALGSPYTATSANISGKPASYSLEDILENFKNCKNKPDLILSVGTLHQNPPSTVVDLTQDPPRIVRNGTASPILN